MAIWPWLAVDIGGLNQIFLLSFIDLPIPEAVPADVLVGKPLFWSQYDPDQRMVIGDHCIKI